jgi:rfaE bifunctional protein kinase chain/domain
MTARDSLLSRLRGRSVLIIGDVMIDHFVIGRVDRISPEAPVPVVRFDHETFRLGGAANVAHNVAALGGQVHLVGITGTDDEAKRVRESLAKLHIGSDGLVEDQSRCTTRKLRVVTARNQQVARVDYESDVEVSGAVEQQIVQRIEALSADAGAMVLSDYLKGTISRGVAQAALATARRRGIPLLVDPKVPHIDYYKGATLITPNHLEAESVTLKRIRSESEARDAARLFRQRADCGSVMITRRRRREKWRMSRAQGTRSSQPLPWRLPPAVRCSIPPGSRTALRESSSASSDRRRYRSKNSWANRSTGQRVSGH